MKTCVEKYIDKAEQQYAQTPEKILGITNDHSSADKRVKRKLTKFFSRHDFVKVALSECERKLEVLAALGQNKSIRVLHIEANNISKHVDGESFGLSFCNLLNARIELDLAANNLWSDSDFKQVFYSVVTSNAVGRLNLDSNNFKGIKRSEPFFHMLFSRRSRISDLSLAGTDLRSCLSDFGMSLLAYGLMFDQPPLLKTINLRNSSTKPSPTPYLKDVSQFNFPSYNGNLNPQLFNEFSRKALKIDKKSGFQLIIEALKKNTTVTSINLSDCQIDDEMAKVVAVSIQENSTLQKLALNNNLIKSKGINAPGKAIGQHPSLETIILASNKKIEKSGWIDFFAALSGNVNLRHLNLDSCAINDTGAAALAAMLKTNGTLKELILSNNRITDEGMIGMAKSLHGHPSIRLLDLAGNKLLLKHVSVLEHLVTDGIRVRVTTDIQYKAAKANGTSLGTLVEANRSADFIEFDDVWLETSW